jgi:inner membrane protein
LRLLLLGFLVLLLLIPIGRISGVIDEREATRDAAVDEVTGKWGRDQSLTGPVLIIPYTHRWTDKSKETRRAYFLPDSLHVAGQIDAEERSRGIFSVPVYKLALELRGAFAPPDWSALGISETDVAWDGAEIAIGISDVRAIQETPELTWGGEKRAFLPGPGALPLSGNGIHVDVSISPGGAAAIPFAFPLRLNGSGGVWLAPTARDTEVTLASSWPSPSFQGNWLPTERDVGKAGFTSTWRIPYLGRNYPQVWTHLNVPTEAVEASSFGVRLVPAVDAHRMSERSIKYAGLFVLLTFAAIWLIEVLAGLRVHPIQYLMIGGAICLFFLLELSLAEHIGFGLSYLLAAFAVVSVVGGYALAVLRSAARASVIAAIVAALYGYLYVLLTQEDYALLVGAIGLFATLGAVMYLTRRVDWYEATREPAQRAPAST